MWRVDRSWRAHRASRHTWMLPAYAMCVRRGYSARGGCLDLRRAFTGVLLAREPPSSMDSLWAGHANVAWAHLHGPDKSCDVNRKVATSPSNRAGQVYASEEPYRSSDVYRASPAARCWSFYTRSSLTRSILCLHGRWAGGVVWPRAVACKALHYLFGAFLA